MFAVFVVVLIICLGEIQNSKLVAPSSKSYRFLYEPGCYVESLDYVLAFNESYSPDDQTCEQYKCDFDGYIYINRCTNKFEGNCLIVPGNKSLKYPDCCDYFDCSKYGKNPALVPAPNTNDAIVQDSPNKNAETPEDLNKNSDLNQSSPTTIQNQNDVETVPENPTDNHTENVTTDKNKIIETKTSTSVEAESSQNSEVLDTASPKKSVENTEDNDNLEKPLSTLGTAVTESTVTMRTKTKKKRSRSSKNKESKGIEESSNTEAKSINED